MKNSGTPHPHSTPMVDSATHGLFSQGPCRKCVCRKGPSTCDSLGLYHRRLAAACSPSTPIGSCVAVTGSLPDAAAHTQARYHPHFQKALLADYGRKQDHFISDVDGSKTISFQVSNTGSNASQLLSCISTTTSILSCISTDCKCKSVILVVTPVILLALL